MIVVLYAVGRDHMIRLTYSNAKTEINEEEALALLLIS